MGLMGFLLRGFARLLGSRRPTRQRRQAESQESGVRPDPQDPPNTAGTCMPRRPSTRHETYEVRCPVYGFITINDWEREIISQPAFQRLRRIRQLAWTDYVFPGAMHTRFEHSLGVTHMVTMLYDGIAQRSADILKHDLGYNNDGLKRHKALVRLAALLHDVGHAPFSHPAEELFPSSVSGSWRENPRNGVQVRRACADT